MNINEKRKSQLRLVSTAIIAIAVIFAVTGIILTVASTNEGLNILKLVFGIIFIILGVAGLVTGIAMSIVTSAVKATNGSIAEDIVGKGTVNMHKCENCGAQVEEGKKICAKCEENLKP